MYKWPSLESTLLMVGKSPPGGESEVPAAARSVLELDGALPLKALDAVL
jgi:hypothetical protein